MIENNKIIIGVLILFLFLKIFVPESFAAETKVGVFIKGPTLMDWWEATEKYSFEQMEMSVFQIVKKIELFIYQYIFWVGFIAFFYVWVVYVIYRNRKINKKNINDDDIT